MPPRLSWIQVHTDVLNTKIVWRAATVLGIEPAHAVGHLVCLWSKVFEHCTNGVVREIPDSQLEAWAGWSGARGAFARFVREHHTTDGQINEWEDYYGALERERAAAAERQRRARSRQSDSTEEAPKPPTEEAAPVDVTPSARDCHGDVTPESKSKRTTTHTPRARARGEADFSTSMPEVAAWQSAHADLSEAFLASLPTRQLRTACMAVAGMALQNGLSDKDLTMAVEDWLANTPGQPALGLWRRYLAIERKGTVAAATPSVHTGSRNGARSAQEAAEAARGEAIRRRQALSAAEVLVAARRHQPDGDAWWQRMESEAAAAQQHPLLYAVNNR